MNVKDVVHTIDMNDWAQEIHLLFQDDQEERDRFIL